ncbi:MAG: glutaredoxin domain-containing protein [Candidatus Ozemobacteraceae bacterium]
MKQSFRFLVLVLLFSALFTPAHAGESRIPFEENNQAGVVIENTVSQNSGNVDGTAVKNRGTNQADKSSIKGEKIIVYGSERCPWCQKTKEYLNSKGIRFIFKEASDSDASQEMIQKLLDHGFNSDNIPVIDIGGDIIQGYDVEQIDIMLEKHGITGNTSRTKVPKRSSVRKAPTTP